MRPQQKAPKSPAEYPASPIQSNSTPFQSPRSNITSDETADFHSPVQSPSDLRERSDSSLVASPGEKNDSTESTPLTKNQNSVAQEVLSSTAKHCVISANDSQFLPVSMVESPTPAKSSPRMIRKARKTFPPQLAVSSSSNFEVNRELRSIFASANSAIVSGLSESDRNLEETLDEDAEESQDIVDPIGKEAIISEDVAEGLKIGAKNSENRPENSEIEQNRAESRGKSPHLNAPGPPESSSNYATKLSKKISAIDKPSQIPPHLIVVGEDDVAYSQGGSQEDVIFLFDENREMTSKRFEDGNRKFLSAQNTCEDGKISKKKPDRKKRERTETGENSPGKSSDERRNSEIGENLSEDVAESTANMKRLKRDEKWKALNTVEDEEEEDDDSSVLNIVIDESGDSPDHSMNQSAGKRSSRNSCHQVEPTALNSPNFGSEIGEPLAVSSPKKSPKALENPVSVVGGIQDDDEIVIVGEYPAENQPNQELSINGSSVSAGCSRRSVQSNQLMEESQSVLQKPSTIVPVSGMISRQNRRKRGRQTTPEREEVCSNLQAFNNPPKATGEGSNNSRQEEEIPSSTCSEKSFNVDSGEIAKVKPSEETISRQANENASKSVADEEVEPPNFRQNEEKSSTSADYASKSHPRADKAPKPRFPSEETTGGNISRPTGEVSSSRSSESAGISRQSVGEPTTVASGEETASDFRQNKGSSSKSTAYTSRQKPVNKASKTAFVDNTISNLRQNKPTSAKPADSASVLQNLSSTGIVDNAASNLRQKNTGKSSNFAECASTSRQSIPINAETAESSERYLSAKETRLCNRFHLGVPRVRKNTREKDAQTELQLVKFGSIILGIDI